ncbi:MAG: FG-GAP-like repeat-containing protein [Acidobacteriaceae bacterium]
MPLAAQVSFTSTTYPAPPGADLAKTTIAADLDHDGNPDLITIDDKTGNNQILISYGTGGGHFGASQAIPVAYAYDVKAADINNDGNLDLIVTGYSAVTILTGYGNRTFSTTTIPISGGARNLAVGDFNGDGKLDFAFDTTYTSPPFSPYIQIYNGNGDGTFSRGASLPISASSVLLIAADLNKDGKLDLINVAEPTTIFLNNGDGTFRAAQTISENEQAGDNIGGGGMGDLNGDAAPDLMLEANINCGRSGCNQVLRSFLNDGAGHFTLKQTLSPADGVGGNVLLADLNYDGKLDVFYPDLGVIGYALGNGDGTFQSIKSAGSLNDSFPLLLAHDLNNDGLPDVVATSFTSLQVELNTTATPDCSSPNSSRLAVHVCSPAPNATVNSPFTVRAVANSATDVLRIEEWVDGHKLYQQFSNQVRNSLTVGAGTHTLTIIPVDIYGGYVRQSLTIHVAAGCSAPSSPGVHVCSPVANGVYGSPVPVSAAGKGASGPVNHMELWIDGRKIGNYPGSQINTTVSLSRNSHSAVVIEVDSRGAFIKSPPIPFNVR